MPYAMICFKVKPGHERELGEIFSEVRPLDSVVVPGPDGEEAGRLLGTGVFVRDDTLVRMIHYQGDFGAIARYLAGQRYVHQIEEAIAPYLAEPRDTSTPEGFAAFFRKASMSVLAQWEAQPEATRP
jgi:hypothetical protein